MIVVLITLFSLLILVLLTVLILLAQAHAQVAHEVIQLKDQLEGALPFKDMHDHQQYVAKRRSQRLEQVIADLKQNHPDWLQDADENDTELAYALIDALNFYTTQILKR